MFEIPSDGGFVNSRPEDTTGVVVVVVAIVQLTTYLSNLGFPKHNNFFYSLDSIECVCLYSIYFKFSNSLSSVFLIDFNFKINQTQPLSYYRPTRPVYVCFSLLSPSLFFHSHPFLNILHRSIILLPFYFLLHALPTQHNFTIQIRRKGTWNTYIIASTLHFY